MLWYILNVLHVPEQDQVGHVAGKGGGSKVVCFYLLSTLHYSLLKLVITILQNIVEDLLTHPVDIFFS